MENDDLSFLFDDIAAATGDKSVLKYKSAPKKTKVNKGLDVPGVVDDELAQLGWSSNARLAMLGNLGRENAWSAKTIFQGHSDPKNAAANLGIISWQGDRRTNLVNYLKRNGGDLSPSENNLRLMTRFMDDELRSNSEWRDIHGKVRNPNISTKESSKLFRRYIKYVPVAPYNTPDDEFDTVNNRNWAEKARKRGLAKGGGANFQAKDLSFLQDDIEKVVGKNPLPQPGSDLSFLAEDINKITGSAPSTTFPAPVAPLPINPFPAPVVPTANETESADIASLGVAKVGRTNFEAQLPPAPLPPDYVEFIKARGFADSTGARNGYSQLMRSAPEAFNPVPDVSAPSQTQPKNVIEQAFPAQNSQLAPVSEQSPIQSPTNFAPGTYDNIQRETFGTVQPSKVYRAKPTPQQYLADAQKETYGANFEAANEAARRITGEPLIDYSAEVSQEDIDSGFNPKTGKVEGIQVAGSEKVRRAVEAFEQGGEEGLKNILPRLEGTANPVPIEPAPDADALLHAQAEENLIRTPLAGTTEADIEAEFQRLKNSQLDPVTAAEAKADAEALNENLGNAGASAIGGYMGGSARVFRTLAGISRPLSSLGIEAPYELFSRIAQKSEILDENTGDGGAMAQLIKIGAGTPTDIARIAGLSRLPGGMVVGFSADHALQSSGRGESLEKVAKEGIKGAALGGVFGVAGRVGGAVKNTLQKNLVNVADAFPSNAAYKAANLTTKVFGETAEIGTIAAGTLGIEKAAGATNQEAAHSAIFNGLFHVANKVGAKAFDKVYKIWENGKAETVYVDPQGSVKLLKGEVEPKFVDAEIISDPTSNAYQASETARNVTPRENQPTRAQAEIENTNAAPRELLGENPKRIEAAKPEAIQKAAVDTRAQKVIENLKDKGAVSIDELQKATRYNKTNVEDAVMLLYAAKQVEILPDNSVRFIGSETATVNKSLFERASEIEKPIDSIKLSKSPVENGVNFTKSVESKISDTKAELNVSEVKQDFVNKAYENLPAQKLEEIKIEKPVAKVITAERPNIAQKLNVFTERGTKASIEPKVIDSSDILTSLDEGYPQQLQPRDRSRAASKAQISEIANKLNPEFLGDSPKASDGRPLMVPVELNGQTKYAVISGNGRSEGIRTAYNLGNDSSKKYAEFAKGKDATSTHKQPVYVGVLDPNEIKDLPEFAKEANESATAQMSATEQAKSDAERLDVDVLNLFVPSSDGTIHGAANRDFTRAFLQRAVPTSEQGRLVDADGKLNQDGANRVRNAIFARAFGDSESGLAAITRMSESTDNNVKNITNGLLAKAGSLAALKQAAKNGTRYKDFDIAPDLARSMEKYASLKDAGTSVEEYIQQGNLFGAETTPFQTRVMQVFDHHKRSPKAIRGIVDNYLTVVEAIGNPNQINLFGKEDIPSVESVFEGAVKTYEKSIIAEPTDQFGIFSQNQGRKSEPATRRESNDNAPPTRQTETSTDESGQDRIDANSSFSLPVDSNQPDFNLPGQTFNDQAVYSSPSRKSEMRDARQRRTADALTDDLIVVIENDFDASSLKRASIAPDGRINPEAFRLMAQTHKMIFNRAEIDVWTGVYLNPYTVTKVREALKQILGLDNNESLTADRKEVRKEANRLLKEFDQAIDAEYGDMVQIVTSKSALFGLKEAIEEEKAHRADYRTGLEHSLGIDVIKKSFYGRMAMRNLQKGAYKGSSEAVIAIETTAKLFVKNSQELGISKSQQNILKLEYLDKLFDNGATALQIEKEFAPIGELGREFSEYAKQREQELQRSAGNYAAAQSGRETQFSTAGESYAVSRQSSGRESSNNTGQKLRDRGSGVLETNGNRGAVINNRTGERTGVPTRNAGEGLQRQPGKTEESRANQDLEQVSIKDEILYARSTPSNPTAIAKAIDFTKTVALDAISVPKSLKASVDISAAGRQGLILTVNHPRHAIKAFGKQFVSVREGVNTTTRLGKYIDQRFGNYHTFKRDLNLHPLIDIAEEAGLYLSTLSNNGSLGSRDEAYMSRLLGDDTLFTNHPKIEKARKALISPVAASERAYVTYLDSIRMDTFASQARSISEYNIRRGNTPAKMGKDEYNAFVGDQMKGLASFINNATGRGGLGKLEDAAPYFNAGFFSIRYLTSRLQLLNPAYYAKLPPKVRSIALTNMILYAGSFASALALLKLAGGDVGYDDPNNPNMFKVSFGDFHYDFGAGFVQPIRYLSRLIKSSIDPKTRGTKELDLTKKFIRSKLAPTPGSLINLYTGKNFIGEPATVAGEARNLVTPMIAEDLPKALQSEGVRGAAKFIPSVFGIGVSIYQPKGKPSTPVSPEQKAQKLEKYKQNRAKATTDKSRASWDKLIKNLEDGK